MPLITLGELNQLRLKIPSKGDLNWSDDFKTQFAQKIVEHDHTGVDGKGKQLTGDSLADGSINRASLIAIDLQDLPNVTDTYSDPNDPNTIQYSTGQVLKYDAATNSWAPGAEGSNVKTISQTASVEAFSGGSVVVVNDIDNLSAPNQYVLDFTSQSSLSNISLLINLSNPTTQKVILPRMENCFIVSNVDVDLDNKLVNCKIIVRREGGFCTTTLSSTSASLEGSDGDFDRLISGAHAGSDSTRFLQSKIKADTLQTQLTDNDSNTLVIDQSEVIVNSLSNSSSLSSASEYLKLQNKSKVAVKEFDATFPVDATRVNLSDADSLLLSVGTSNNMTAWNGSRFNHLASPSGINKIITADSSGNPVEISIPSGSVAVARSAGLGTEEYKLSALDDYSSTVDSSTDLNYPVVLRPDGTFSPSEAIRVETIRHPDWSTAETHAAGRILLSNYDVRTYGREILLQGVKDSNNKCEVELQVSNTSGNGSSSISLQNDEKADLWYSTYPIGWRSTNHNQGLSFIDSNVWLNGGDIVIGYNQSTLGTLELLLKHVGEYQNELENTGTNVVINKKYAMPTVDVNPYIEFKSGSTNSGDIFRVSTSSVQYNTSSDYRLKENVKSIENASSMVMQLNPCTFDWKEDKIKDCGFIAHEVDEIYPYTVVGEKDAVNEDGSIKAQSMDYGKMTPLLTAALKEALVKIDSLEARIKELEDKE